MPQGYGPKFSAGSPRSHPHSVDLHSEATAVEKSALSDPMPAMVRCRRWRARALCAAPLKPAHRSPTCAAPHLLRAQSKEKLNLAVIGVQGRGWANISQIRHENIVAICDVDLNHLERVGEQFPDARRYRDFREMLVADLDLDAVLVSTPWDMVLT